MYRFENPLSFFHGGRGIRTRMDEAMSPSIAMYVALTFCALETSLKQEAQIAQLNITAITVPSVYGFLNSFLNSLFNFLRITVFNKSGDTTARSIIR